MGGPTTMRKLIAAHQHGDEEEEARGGRGLRDDATVYLLAAEVVEGWLRERGAPWNVRPAVCHDLLLSGCEALAAYWAGIPASAAFRS